MASLSLSINQLHFSFVWESITPKVSIYSTCTCQLPLILSCQEITINCQIWSASPREAIYAWFHSKKTFCWTWPFLGFCDDQLLWNYQDKTFLPLPWT
jgi:hypothetical protein